MNGVLLIYSSANDKTDYDVIQEHHRYGLPFHCQVKIESHRTCFLLHFHVIYVDVQWACS